MCATESEYETQIIIESHCEEKWDTVRKSEPQIWECES